MSGATLATRTIRPPNPATAVTWILLLLTASAIAQWLITPRIERALSGDYDAIVWVSPAAVAGKAWLAIVIASMAGLTD